MFDVGDRAILKYCDSPDNQEIIGKIVTVVVAPNKFQSPFWMDVEFEGRTYSVRGADCRKVGS